jgi:hypothetical protein
MDAVSVQGVAAASGLAEGRVDAIRRMGAERGRDAAARELQVALFTQLLEAMRKTLPENSLLPRSPARDVYDGLFDRELANALATGDPLGLVEHFGRAAAGSTDGPSGPDGAEPPSAGADDGVVARQDIATIGSTGRGRGARRHDGPHGAGQIPDAAQATLTAHAMKRATAPGSIQESTRNGR